VFIRVAKLMVDDGEPVFHHWFAVNSPAAVNQQQVMKMAQLLKNILSKQVQSNCCLL